MVNKHTTYIQRQARFFVYGENSKHTEHIWFVCHGYMQLADDFIKNFQKLDPKKHLVIAPEGFHRFYSNGQSGEVVASWMTSLERKADIKDYVNYLDKVYDEIMEQAHHPYKIHVLGFSQGGATASRWVCQGKSKVDSLTLWASALPPDMDYNLDVEKLNEINLNLVVGNRDQYISEENIVEHKQHLDAHKIEYNLLRFDGGHRLDYDTLNILSKQL